MTTTSSPTLVPSASLNLDDLGLSHTQENLIQTIKAQERYLASKKAVSKRGFMKLTTELSRSDLAETARRIALARMEEARETAVTDSAGT